MAQAPKAFMSGLTGFFGGDRNQNENQNGNGNQDPPLDDDYVEEEQEPGLGDHIGQIFTPPDEEEIEEEPVVLPKTGPDGKPLPTQQEKMAKSIADAIAKMGTPALPENFDPTDTKQLTDYMAQSNQATALATIQLAFQPMQMLMEEAMSKFTKTIDERLNGFGNQQSESAILKELVPEIEDPKYSGLVQTLFKQSKESKDGKGNPKVAAQMVRNALNSMGVKMEKKPDAMSGGFKSGKDALEAYAPLTPQRPRRPNPQGQGGGNGQ